MTSHDKGGALSPLEQELVALLQRYDIEPKLIQDHLARVRAIVAIQEVSKLLGRSLNRDERKRAHVQFMDGRNIEEIVNRLSRS